jgi:tetratricopeptide (TPR) repeat protein
MPGCASTREPSDKERLNAAYLDLEGKRYDRAFAAAEAYLQKSPAGPGSAEALYLQGRVYEARAEAAGTAGQPDEARGQLTSAATAYLRALQLKPSPSVEGLAHAGLANAAFHLDDFATAVREWGLSFPLIARPDAKAEVLYRIGVCQQRLGWFEMADQSFARVQQEYRDQEAAGHAAGLIGQRAFYVQVGVFSSAKNAEKELAELRANKMPALRETDPATGRQVVRIGPYRTYADARITHLRVVGHFPEAVIVP